MSFLRTSLALTALSLAAMAHPMGNFSVNHYSRLYFGAGRVELTYVLDLAEIPTFELLGEWQIDRGDAAALVAKSQPQARVWVDHLELEQDGEQLPLRLLTISPKTTEGAGGMPVLRIAIKAWAALRPGDVSYEDRNFPGRAGWKEIVIDHGGETMIRSSSAGAEDLSRALTYYPTDPGLTPPQQLSARVNWVPVVAMQHSEGEALGSGGRRGPAGAGEPSATGPSSVRTPAATGDAAVQAAPAAIHAVPAASFSQQQPTAPGTVVRGDFLSRLLRQREIGWGVALLGLLAALGLGAMHAMSPGHGKTIVAAYLVGSRGTAKHAMLLGFVVTFTHTFTVFLLGLGVLFFQKYVIPEKIVPILGAVSGLSIVSVGALLLYRRAKALMEGGRELPHAHHHHHEPDRHHHEHEPVHVHSHAGEPAFALAGHNGHAHANIDQEHGHDHSHHHDHKHAHEHGHIHEHSHPLGIVHSHGGAAHSHDVPERVTLGSLIALGVSGGLVPCPSALILMLSAIALGRPGLGLVLLIGFSAGLAMVLMGIGMIAVYAKHLLPDNQATARQPIFRLIPVFSAVVVICLGLAMTAVSMGWLQPLRFLS